MNIVNEMYKDQVPNVTFKTRVQDEAGEYVWKDVNSAGLFKNKKVVVFGLPGAFTPTCSSTHLPGYEATYDQFKEQGIDDVYCVSVNDAFVMNSWAKDVGAKNVKLIPDGNGEFTKGMDMLVNKKHLGFGDRSWRYSALVKNGAIIKMFVEPGKNNTGSDMDPFKVSDSTTMLDYIKEIVPNKYEYETRGTS
jgi:peroxiredoxin